MSDYDAADNAAKSYEVAIKALREKLQGFRQERIGDCWLINGDCREVLPLLPKVDAVVTDPPYGIGESSKKNATRGKSSSILGKSKGGSAVAYARDYGENDWDKEPASAETIKRIIDGSKWQIIFGGNYFEGLPPSSCWLVWDKKNGSNDFADCELAWTNLPKAVRRIEWLWNGMIRKGQEDRVHLTQKPIGVMKWAIEHIPEPCRTILDPFMGSGTTGVACVKLGRKFIGVEIDAGYFEIACKRIRDAYAQPDMFIEQEKQPKAEQLDMMDVMK